MVETEEPDRQRNPGAVEDGAGGDRCLVATGGALVEARSRCQTVPTDVLAARADEAVRPAQRLEREQTLRLGAVGLLEGRFAETLLELDAVACHRGACQAAEYTDQLYSTTGELSQVRKQEP